MSRDDKDVETFLAEKANVVIPLERRGALSATEVLATHSWFRERVNELKSSGGRPTNPQWTIKRQIPMTSTLWEQLKALAGSYGDRSGVRVGPGQLASFLLEDAVVSVVAGAARQDSARHVGGHAVVAELPDPEDERARVWEPQEPFFRCAA